MHKFYVFFNKQFKPNNSILHNGQQKFEKIFSIFFLNKLPLPIIEKVGNVNLAIPIARTFCYKLKLTSLRTLFS